MMKKIYLLLIAIAFLGVLNAQTWNISDPAFNALGNIATTTTVEGLTIYSDNNVTVDANNKTLDDVDYTHRLKLGGSGNFDEGGLPVSRVLAFDVTGDVSITVMSMSSSGSEDRSLNVAAGGSAEENILGSAIALGASLTATTFEYTGDATTIYLWSPSSGVNIYAIVVEEAPADEVAWNISTEAFNALGTIVTTTTVEGLTIYSDNNVTVDANNKTLDGVDYTHRLKLGGSGKFDEGGLPVYRVIAFEVAGDASITVMCMSSSSSEDRSLKVAAGGSAEGNILGSATALGASLSATTFEYTGDATTIYMWSPSSGVNIYNIVVKAGGGATSIFTPKYEGRVVSTEFYNINGMKVDNRFDALPAGIYIEVSRYENGAIATQKIIKSRR